MDLYDEFVSQLVAALGAHWQAGVVRHGGHISRPSCCILPARLQRARTELTARIASQGNYIGPEDDLESDYSDDEAGEQQQQDGAASPAPAPLRAYDEDEAEPLEGMEVDGAFARAFSWG